MTDAYNFLNKGKQNKVHPVTNYEGTDGDRGNAPPFLQPRR